MQFVFETEYNQKAIKAMAYLMRKTMRKTQNRRSRVLGWIVLIVAALLTVPALKGDADIKWNTIATWVVMLIMIITLLFEDAINAYMSRRRMLAGTEKAVAEFLDEKYISATAVGKTEFSYASIAMIAENSEYFAFILDRRYAQIYDKSHLSGGSVDEFRAFIKEKTGKEVKYC